LLREAAGETSLLEDYLVRFPEYADDLRTQIELHRAMASRPATDCSLGSADIFSIDVAAPAGGDASHRSMEATPMSQDTNQNILFGVMALHAGLIDRDTFAEVCSLWSKRRDTPLAEILLERGWITAEDNAHLDYLLKRGLECFGGDARARLTTVMLDDAKRLLSSLDDAEIQQIIAGPTAGDFGVAEQKPPDRSPVDERYTLTRLHARGGIGQIWLARDADLGREVALKEIRPERVNDPSLLGRFFDEARITGRLEHPGIVPVYELVQHSGERNPFYTMRFLRGRSLTEAVKTYHKKHQSGKAGVLELRELLGIFISICNALAFAHSKQVLHRDLKGQNVMLGDYGEVMVVDWGMAKDTSRAESSVAAATEEAASGSPSSNSGLSRDETLPGQVLGTPGYMSPEQAQGFKDVVDQRSDVYGLGAVLYEILTAHAPFEGNDPLEILRRVANDPPIPPRQLAAGTPPGLEAICLKALAKKPESRYQSAMELGKDVQHWLADEPVSAYRDPWTVRARRWLGRHRTLVASASAAVLMAAVVLGLATVSLRAANIRESRSRTRAEENFALAREAVDKYFTRVSTSSKLKAHGLEGLRKELLQETTQFYEKFVQTEAGRPGLKYEQGWANVRLGAIKSETGDLQAAEALYRKAQSIFAALLKEQPSDPPSCVALANAYNQLGILHSSLGQKREAEDEFSTALGIMEALCAANPDQLAFRADLAEPLNSFGNFYYYADRMRDAENSYQRALAIYEELAQREPESASYRMMEARLRTNLGLLYIRTAQYAKAESSLQRAQQDLELLAHEFPAEPDYQNLLAIAHTDLGTMYLNTKRVAKAGEEYRKAVLLQEKLWRKHPDFLDVAARLGSTYAGLGDVDREGNNFNQALRSYAKAFDTLDRVLDVEPRFELALNMRDSCRLERAIAFGMQGDYESATRDVEAMRPEGRSSARDLYNLACVYGLCAAASGKDPKLPSNERHSRANGYATQGVELLRQAIAKGYKNMDAIKTDSDLDCLRGRDDFKQLIAGLPKK
jgi:serine/threonine-protein kinase